MRKKKERKKSMGFCRKMRTETNCIISTHFVALNREHSPYEIMVMLEKREMNILNEQTEANLFRFDQDVHVCADVNSTSRRVRGRR